MREPDERILSSGCTPGLAGAGGAHEESPGHSVAIDGRLRPTVASELFAIGSMLSWALAVRACGSP
jgi:hypothetical protein